MHTPGSWRSNEPHHHPAPPLPSKKRFSDPGHLDSTRKRRQQKLIGVILAIYLSISLTKFLNSYQCLLSSLPAFAWSVIRLIYWTKAVPLPSLPHSTLYTDLKTICLQMSVLYFFLTVFLSTGGSSKPSAYLNSDVLSNEQFSETSCRFISLAHFFCM